MDNRLIRLILQLLHAMNTVILENFANCVKSRIIISVTLKFHDRSMIYLHQ